MVQSYKSVNYALRPAKNIERKMLCEVINRLEKFDRVYNYRYIGFGSTFFSDFSLFHKSLKITKNISIEREIQERARFEFNRPYRCIDLKFGDSNEILPKLQWNVKTIIWLDYDEPISQNILTDVEFVCANATSGSLLIVTVNAQPDDFNKRVKSFKKRVGETKFPEGISEAKLGGWGTAQISRRIINNEIEMSINIRNGGKASGTKLKYKQLFNFQYADGAKMLTVGGILYDESQYALVEKCGFENIEFIRTGEQPYLIEVPSLTLKEIKYLDKLLPCDNVDEIATWIPKEDRQRYSKIYRYFPAFVDAELG